MRDKVDGIETESRRVTLPQKRSLETRQLIVDAAARVFAREGYGEAVVEDILAEANVSRGAFYHHFTGKGDVFKAVMDAHVHDDIGELEELGPADSLRGLLERYVQFQLGHAGTDDSGLSLEFWAAAAHDEAFREPVNDFHRRSLNLHATLLRLGQRYGAFRKDLDVDAAAFLLIATFEGVHVLLCLDPEVVDPKQLVRPWVDLLERFVVDDNQADIAGFQADLAVLLQQFRAGQQDLEVGM